MSLAKGPKVYFPNFVFTMIRSGKDRKKNEVVFRVPVVLNKLDIKQYLEGIYNVKVKDIRTTIFLPKITRMGRSYTPTRKNAVVTLSSGYYEFPPLTDSKLLKFPLQNEYKFPKFC